MPKNGGAQQTGKNCTSALVSYLISCHKGDIFLCLFSYLRWFSANIKCIRTWWRKRNWYLFYILILFSYFLKVVRLADRKMQEYQTPGLQQTPSAFSWEKIRKKDPPPSILGFGWLTFTNIKIDKNLTFSALLIVGVVLTPPQGLKFNIPYLSTGNCSWGKERRGLEFCRGAFCY